MPLGAMIYKLLYSTPVHTVYTIVRLVLMFYLDLSSKIDPYFKSKTCVPHPVL